MHQHGSKGGGSRVVQARTALTGYVTEAMIHLRDQLKSVGVIISKPARFSWYDVAADVLGTDDAGAGPRIDQGPPRRESKRAAMRKKAAVRAEAGAEKKQDVEWHANRIRRTDDLIVKMTTVIKHNQPGKGEKDLTQLRAFAVMMANLIETHNQQFRELAIANPRIHADLIPTITLEDHIRVLMETVSTAPLAEIRLVIGKMQTLLDIRIKFLEVYRAYRRNSVIDDGVLNKVVDVIGDRPSTSPILNTLLMTEIAAKFVALSESELSSFIPNRQNLRYTVLRIISFGLIEKGDLDKMLGVESEGSVEESDKNPECNDGPAKETHHISTNVSVMTPCLIGRTDVREGFDCDPSQSLPVH